MMPRKFTIWLHSDARCLAGALVIFYILLAALAAMDTKHTLLVLLLLLVYFLILRNLAKLFRSLADTGYAVTAAPVRVSNGVLLWSYLGALLAAVLLCMFLGQRFPAALHLRDDAPQDEQIRQELLQKGFPRNVLDDLTADEVAKMAGARAVYRETDKLYNDTEYREITLTHYIADPCDSTAPSPPKTTMAPVAIPTSTGRMTRWSRP